MEREGTASLYQQPGLSALVLERFPGSPPCGAGAGGGSLLYVGGLVISCPKPWGVYLAAGGCCMRQCLSSQAHSAPKELRVSSLLEGLLGN